MKVLVEDEQGLAESIIGCMVKDGYACELPDKTNRIYLDFLLVIYPLMALAIYQIVRVLIHEEVILSKEKLSRAAKVTFLTCQTVGAGTSVPAPDYIFRKTAGA